MDSLNTIIDEVCRNLSLPYELKDEQRRIIGLILSRKNVFGLLPTGFGKSDCFALLPSAIQKIHPGKKAVVLVVSPLRSLMIDVAARYNKIGIPSVAILRHDEMTEVQIKGLKEAYFHVVLSSPEAVLMDPWQNIVRSWGEAVCCLAIDEAHCVTHWGKSFRLSYQKIVELRSFISAPVLTLTATATSSMVTEILSAVNLNLKETEIVAILPDRSNIQLHMVRTVESGSIDANLKWIVTDILQNGDAARKTIVYTRTIDAATKVFGSLFKSLGDAIWVSGNMTTRLARVEMYHGSTDPEKQYSIINRFVSGRSLKTVVATLAFGMGVDVRDVDSVVHWGPSKSILDYWQQVGRCARDGRPGLAHLYITPGCLHPNTISPEMINIIQELERSRGCKRKAFLKHLFVHGMSEQDLENCSHPMCCNHCIQE